MLKTGDAHTLLNRERLALASFEFQLCPLCGYPTVFPRFFLPRMFFAVGYWNRSSLFPLENLNGALGRRWSVSISALPL